MNILDLPTELITQCLSYLKGFELARLRQTCTAFKEITEIDLLWQKTCNREYCCRSLEGWRLSYRQLYAKVLHKYGYLLGLWKDTSSCYGGLVHIWYNEGCIRGEEYYPTKDVRKPLLKKEIFTIEMSDDNEIEARWNPGYCDPQPCDIENGTVVESVNKTAVIKKRWKEDFQPDKTQEQKEMVGFLEECSVRGTHPELCMFKWQSHKKIKLSQTLQTLPMSAIRPDDPHLPSPGLYKGLYGGHGTELVYLSYDLDRKKAYTRKISGDPNVPAGEISITADLTKPLVLTKEEQETIESLKSVQVWEGHRGQGEGPREQGEELRDKEAGPTEHSGQSVYGRQPFVIPREVSAEDEFLLPKYCVARYLSQGTVSPMGYSRPQQIVNHFIVFDENTFVILWLDLYTCAIFSRVHEAFETLGNN